MKLFGKKSISFYLHWIFRITSTFFLVLTIFTAFHFLMALLHHWGIPNMFASVETDTQFFKIHYKLISDQALRVPIFGNYDAFTFMFSTVFSFVCYFLFTRIISRIFKDLSSDSIFVDNLSKHTRWLSALIFLLVINNLVLFATNLDEHTGYLFEAITLTILSIIIWFLSKIFEEGSKMQKEIELTI